MGLLSKIKDILFEDEGEEPSTSEMPVFTKEDSVAGNKDSEIGTVSFDDDEDEPLRVTTGSRFRNDKRDLELDDTDLFEENKEEKPKDNEDEIELPMPKLEDSSPILPFDEDEFDRLNARVNKEIEKAQEKSVRETYQERENLLNNVDARKANNNFSSTDDPRERYESAEKGEKKFTPSPVISPVYGILDKNYKKDDIVDRVGGLKREKKIVKPKVEETKPEDAETKEVTVEITKKEVVIDDIPILKEEKATVNDEPIKVDLDSVRKKAFGSIDNLLEEALEEVNNSNGELPKPEPEPIEVEDVTPVVVEEEPEVKEAVIEEEKAKEPILDKEEPKVEEEVQDDSDKMIEDLLDEGEKQDKEDVSELILKDIDEEEERKEKELDDLEKTSTLKILDDIEKELNDVEPVAKKENLDNTLESDLFNLIDSMYEKGENE